MKTIFIFVVLIKTLTTTTTTTIATTTNNTTSFYTSDNTNKSIVLPLRTPIGELEDTYINISDAQSALYDRIKSSKYSINPYNLNASQSKRLDRQLMQNYRIGPTGIGL